MDTNERKQRLEMIRHLADELLDDLQPDTPAPFTAVRQGDNLWSMIEGAPAGARFRLAPEFRIDGEFTFDKPVTLEKEPDRPAAVIIGEHYITDDPEFLGLTFVGKGTGDRSIFEMQNETAKGPSWQHCNLGGSAKGQRRGIAWNGRGGLFSGGSITNIWHKHDAQAICSWDGGRNGRVENALLEASGEVVMLGGGDPATVDRIPTGMQFQGNMLTRPIAWRGRTDMTIKNLFEIKNAIGTRFTDNQLENCWSAGQTGYAILVTVRNQGNTGAGAQSIIADTLIARNKIRHCGAGVMIDGRDYMNPSRGIVGLDFQWNVYEDIDPAKWGGDGRQVYIMRAPQFLRFKGERFTGANNNSAFYFGGDQQLEGFEVIDHVAMEGDYGIFRDGGTPGITSLEDVTSQHGCVWQDVRLKRTGEPKSIPYPVGTLVE